MGYILIVDDETTITDIIEFNLQKEGFETKAVHDGKEALLAVNEHEPDLMLLDVMMPEMDGFKALELLRQKYKFPILMLTAKEEEADKVKGLELGADDYITKPFGIRELIARVEANLRRAPKIKTTENSIVIGDIRLDLTLLQVFKKEKPVELTLREFEVLKYLMQHPNEVFSRTDLLKDVWGYDYIGDVRTVDVTIRRVREKVDEKLSDDYKYIKTRRNMGYYISNEI
ncbi:MAG: response regulator [Fenollaria massiliensis]|uniref:Stage 0 sporulation protein A homolog n=1 Tax=Fenollaria massiliensis TaxID=938288 RepID=A0A9E7IUF9_9FIRM|nr:response regulator [Fenollaria massiliensis]AVM67178.1 DNA-binding response regulator [Peptostreptococcaceae bacterium oral taxon 929]OFK79923.1 DNA-binding response regulator [Anaerosphaera sp. HMSC064C01]UQK59033.1 response regulator transcription factor [Fenollaria massiliensis]